MEATVSSAARLFNCKTTEVGKFSRPDPFNGGVVLGGYICRKKGPTGGSLILTSIDDVEVDPMYIQGTPKLAYPYENNSDGEPGNNAIKKFPAFYSWSVFAKHNGMNVLFFTYKGLDGSLKMSAKSKGSAILADGDFGKFLSLTQEALKDEGTKKIISDWFSDPNRMPGEGFSFELCGRKEPHLVKYDFDIRLCPLFFVEHGGKIRPYTGPGNGVIEYGPAGLLHPGLIKKWQEMDYNRNDSFRNERGLRVRYEYEHFATEGRVLYLLDENGFLVDNVMYKVKPKDVEEVHWKNFDSQLEARVREAVHKIKCAECAVTEYEVRSELDMGPKEWGKFGRKIMDYIKTLYVPKESGCRVVVLCGLPGSGKSTAARAAKARGGKDKWEIVNQDTLGSRPACVNAACMAITEGKSVIVDRCNFDNGQRNSWLSIANDFDLPITAVVFTTPVEVCATRISNRHDHPTVPPTMTELPDKFHKMWVNPHTAHGFKEVVFLPPDATVDDAVAAILKNS